ncbi:hypothetical protein [Xylocopilactobacillus apis]|uniref:Uncharacterized protein n=1 Tax=Xylocopilactobacillus apis TaxID=2932183 RepID=A0AAU9D0J9_9LACO|nr:hypothetical protein [Xylocopilactobacillus apis]BDR56036.1 hypothetical protein KIMC2_05980 [Xylocopilactobacillus apis]
MEIAILEASKLIEEEKYFFEKRDLLLKEFIKDDQKLIQKSFETVKNNYEKNGLAMYQFDISDLDDLKVNVFSNIINLPYSYANKYAEFFSDGSKAEIKFYFSIESPYVNKSKLWIAEINNLDENVKVIEECLGQAKQNLTEDKKELSNEKITKK